MKRSDEDELIVVVEATPVNEDGTLLTNVKRRVLPFLPPPVVAVVDRIDPQLEPYVGSDGGSVLLLATGLLIVLCGWIVGRLGGSGRSAIRGSGRSAIRDSDDDRLVARTKDDSVGSDATILLCGPSGGGKTALFYRLLSSTDASELSSTVSSSSEAFVPNTVKSIQSNIGYLKLSDDRVLRVIDVPGCWNTSSSRWSQIVSSPSLLSARTNRTVLVLDSTQSVVGAVEYLVALQKRMASMSPLSQKESILIVAAKSKLPKAKNVRRIKLQLRTELERYATYSSGSEGGSATKNWDDYLNTHAGFVSVSLREDPEVGWNAVMQYCSDGTVPKLSRK